MFRLKMYCFLALTFIHIFDFSKIHNEMVILALSYRCPAI